MNTDGLRPRAGQPKRAGLVSVSDRFRTSRTALNVLFVQARTWPKRKRGPGPPKEGMHGEAVASRGPQEGPAAPMRAFLYNPNQIWNFGIYPMMKITTMSTGMP